MELRILGCSGGEADGERLTGLLVNGCVAIDAGSITAALTVEEQVKIQHVFISHSHLDHICTLPFFTKNIFGHTHSAVEIHALPETLDVLRRHLFNDELWPDFSVIPSPNDPTIRYTDVEAERTYHVCGLRITPIRVNHLVPCVGYKVEDGPPPSYHTGRTCPFPSIIHLYVVNSFNAIGPRACSFWVLMPISAPSPNCAPSVKAVEVLA